MVLYHTILVQPVWGLQRSNTALRVLPKKQTHSTLSPLTLREADIKGVSLLSPNQLCTVKCMHTLQTDRSAALHKKNTRPAINSHSILTAIHTLKRTYTEWREQMKHFEIDRVFFLMIIHKGLANIILYSANIYRWSYIEYTVQQRNTRDDDD